MCSIAMLAADLISRQSRDLLAPFSFASIIDTLETELEWHDSISVSLQVHWGFYSRTLAPKLTINSGDTVTVEMITHHAGDYYDGELRELN